MLAKDSSGNESMRGNSGSTPVQDKPESDSKELEINNGLVEENKNELNEENQDQTIPKSKPNHALEQLLFNISGDNIHLLNMHK